VSPRSRAFAITFAAMIACASTGCSTAFDDAACTLDLRQYPIAVSRDFDFDFANASKLKVEACAIREGQSPTCATVAATEDPSSKDDFTLGSSTDSVEGKLAKTSDPKKTKLALTVHLGEGAPSSTTTVRVRVLDDADKEITKAEGPVRWSSDDCHPTPDVKSI